MNILYIICLLYLIFLSGITKNTLPKLLMIISAVIGVVSLLNNELSDFPIWITVFNSFLFMFTKANFNGVSVKGQKFAQTLRTISLIVFILSIITITKL